MSVSSCSSLWILGCNQEYHDANVVVTGGRAGCRDDKVGIMTTRSFQCHYTQQACFLLIVGIVTGGRAGCRDDKVGIMTTHSFQCHYTQQARFLLILGIVTTFFKLLIAGSTLYIG